MAESLEPIQVSPLREHDFRSRVPIAGPFIGWLRRTLYRLTARWGVLALTHQQARINQTVATYLQDYHARLSEYESRLIEQDRDLAHLSRIAAEIEIRQRYLAKQASAPDRDD